MSKSKNSLPGFLSAVLEEPGGYSARQQSCAECGEATHSTQEQTERTSRKSVSKPTVSLMRQTMLDSPNDAPVKQHNPA